MSKTYSRVAIQPQIGSGNDLSLDKSPSLLELLKPSTPLFCSFFLLVVFTSASHAQSVSQLIDELSGDRPLVEGELFNIQLPETGEDRHVEILLKTADSEIRLASFYVDGSEATLGISGEELWGPDPGRVPEGQVISRIRNESGELLDLLTIQSWNQKPSYPTGGSHLEVMNRISKKLRDGYPVEAYRELKEQEASAANREEEAEWYRLNASVLDVFARIDRVQGPRSKRELNRAFELAPEDSPVQTRALIDRAKRAREEGTGSSDAGESRRALIRSLEDARSALTKATVRGDRALAAEALVEIALTAAARGWLTETRTAVESARELRGDLETLWKTDLALAKVYQFRSEYPLAIEHARGAVEAVEQIRLRYSSDHAAMFQRREPAFLLTELLAQNGEVVASLHASEFLRVRNPGEVPPDLKQIEALAVEAGNQFTIQVMVNCGTRLLTWTTNDGSWNMNLEECEKGELIGFIESLHSSRGKDLESAAWISSKLFGARVPVTERLLLVPLDELRRIPWGMLPVSGRSLMDRTTFSLLPNLKSASRELSLLPAEDWLSLVDPDAPQKARLPGARAEGEAVAKKLVRSTILSGGVATVTELEDQLHGKKVLHLACHGDFDPRDPRSSSLRLTPDQNFADGKLLARNIAGWNLSDCRIVLLTGCETALAGGLGADDLAGFPRAVLEAGCQGILGSLWPVEDEVTRQMTLHLIDSARARISPAEALREACRSIRDKSTTDRVSGWSGWVLVENGR
ncbi:MAG: CHAT domain-containing protein [Planctomycetota bacterium]